MSTVMSSERPRALTVLVGLVNLKPIEDIILRVGSFDWFTSLARQRPPQEAWPDKLRYLEPDLPHTHQSSFVARLEVSQVKVK